jgi:hypothetical protein
MNAAVFDTYVPKKEGGLMHFDIIVPRNTTFEKVVDFGKEYLASKSQQGQPLTPEECQFCHVEHPTPEMAAAFGEKGYFIVEMQGCN